MNADIHRKRRKINVYSDGESIGSHQRLYQRKETGFRYTNYDVHWLIRARFGHGSG